MKEMTQETQEKKGAVKDISSSKVKEKEVATDDQGEQKLAKEKKKYKESELNTQLDQLKVDLEEAKDKYLRLYSEFENYKRRTSKEKIELVKTANEDLVVSLLSFIDDFERAEKSQAKDRSMEALKEGFQLIFQKFYKTLAQYSLKAMEDKKGTEFDTEIHEAISHYPAPEKKLKGKVIEVVQKGYYLSEKVIRFAKVVTGA